MHIPDGFIADPRIWGGCYALSLPVLTYAARRTRDAAADRAVLLSGMTGAFLFAAQMFNFPVAAGTSGHLLGGTLACALVGGWGGMLVTSLVLIVQCLLFQDGGITALGANILNMAVIGGGGGYLLFRLVGSRLASRRLRLAALGVCAGLGVVVSAGVAAIEIGLSGVAPLETALTAMLLVHLPIGVIEGLATASVVGALEQVRPDLTQGFSHPAPARWSLATLWGAIVLLALLAVAFASSAPDGLETVAQQLGFDGRALAVMPSPFPDYELSGFTSFAARAGVALGGLLIAVLSGCLLTRFLRREGATQG